MICIIIIVIIIIMMMMIVSFTFNGKVGCTIFCFYISLFEYNYTLKKTLYGMYIL